VLHARAAYHKQRGGQQGWREEKRSELAASNVLPCVSPAELIRPAAQATGGALTFCWRIADGQ
jgi:hypothetical protein